MSADERTRFELAYWRALLDDLQDAYAHVRRAGELQAEIPILLLESLVAERGADNSRLVQASKASRDTMHALLEATKPLDRILALVEGRISVLVEEPA